MLPWAEKGPNLKQHLENHRFSTLRKKDLISETLWLSLFKQSNYSPNNMNCGPDPQAAILEKAFEERLTGNWKEGREGWRKTTRTTYSEFTYFCMWMLCTCRSPNTGTTLFLPMFKKFWISEYCYPPPIVLQCKRIATFQAFLVLCRYWKYDGNAQVNDTICENNRDILEFT